MQKQSKITLGYYVKLIMIKYNNINIVVSSTWITVEIVQK